MKRIYLSILFAGILIAFTSPAKAQVHFSLGVNLGTQPAWGPVGYDEAQYYYLPDIDAYYNVPSHRFYYNERGRWISSSNLPPRYHDYDLYGSYKVVVNERQPWKHHEMYRDKYASFKGRHDQQPIRDSREPKYFANKNHPQHNAWVREQRHNNGNHFGQNNGNKNDNGNGNKGRNDNKGDQGKGNGNKGHNDNKDDHGNGKP